MQVRKVTLDALDDTYCCMAGLPPDHSWRDALPQSREWFRLNLGKQIEGYHLLDGEKVVGMMYWVSSEYAAVPYLIEPNVAFIYCTEVLQDYKHKGHGRMLFDCAKEDMRKRGFKGILVDATDIKEYMPHEDFLKQGFRTIKEHPPFKLMYFPLSQKSVDFQLVNLTYKPSTDKVEVTLFNNFSCPVGVHMHHLIKRIAESFGDQVKIVEIKATPETVRKYGTLDPLINGKIKIFGPAKEDDVRKAIQEEIDQLKS